MRKETKNSARKPPTVEAFFVYEHSFYFKLQVRGLMRVIPPESSCWITA